MQYNGPVQYEQPIYSDPTLPIVFHADRMDASRRAVYTNWHAGVEILHCVEGAGQLLVGAESVDFKAGELVVISSNSIHTLHLQDTHCLYYCMIVEPQFLAEHGLHVEDVRFAPVIRSETPIEHYRCITRAYAEADPLYKPIVLSHLFMLFVSLLQSHVQPLEEPQPAVDRRGRRMIAKALEYIREHLCDTMHIEQISRHVGMSKFYFCRMFQAYTGMSVVQHINALKCDYARKLMLENGFNVSEAAHHLGFQQVSYFSKLYKKHLGVLPSSELIEKKRSNKRGEVYGTIKGIHDEA